MKYLLILLIALSLQAQVVISPANFTSSGGGGGGASLALEQTASGQGTNPSATFSGAVSSGNLIVVMCGQGDDGTATTWTISDTESNTYTSAIRQTGTSVIIQQWYCANVTGGSSFAVTATQSGSSENTWIIVHEISGAATSSPLDKTAGGSGSSTTPTTASTGTLSQADEIAVYGVATRLAGYQTSDPTTAGFDRDETINTSGEWGGGTGHTLIVSSTTAISGDGTTADVYWATCLGTYKQQ